MFQDITVEEMEQFILRQIGLFFFKILFIFRQREEREKEVEKEAENEGEGQCVVASRAPPTGDIACNPGMCPHWELIWRPLGLQAGTQSTEPPQPGPSLFFSLW